MNKIDGKTLQELLSSVKILPEELNSYWELENNYFPRKNSSLELANSLTDNLSSNLLFLSLILGDKFKI